MSINKRKMLPLHRNSSLFEKDLIRLIEERAQNGLNLNGIRHMKTIVAHSAISFFAMIADSDIK